MNTVQVGVAAYRKLRWEGKTPLPRPIVLPQGINGTIPSRDPGREITYRVFKPKGGVSKGIHLHIHGGGWVLQSEHQYVLFLPDLGRSVCVVKVEDDDRSLTICKVKTHTWSSWQITMSSRSFRSDTDLHRRTHGRLVFTMCMTRPSG